MRVAIYPNSRLVYAALRREVDVAATVQGKDDGRLFFSNHYVWFDNFVISKAKNKIQISSLADLEGHSFVIWRDGWKNLGPEFQSKFRPVNGKYPDNYFDGVTQLNQAKIFWSERTKLIIVDKMIFEYYRKDLSKEFDTSESVTYHDIFKGPTGYSVAFKDEKLRNHFNVELKEFLAAGCYNKIMEKYKKKIEEPGSSVRLPAAW